MPLGRGLGPMERGGTRRRTRRRMDRRAGMADDAQDQTAPQAAPAGPAVSGSDNLAELEKLGELRDKGVITPEEFEAKKKQLLGL